MIRQVQEIVNAADGSEHRGYFVVFDIAYRKTKTGHDYATLLLQDASGTVPAKIWRDKLLMLDKHGIRNQSQVMADVKVRRFRGRAEAEVRFIRPVTESDLDEGFDETALEPRAARNIEVMYSELLSLIDTMENGPLMRLVLKVLERCGRSLKTAPGARSIHHAYRGGLLEHTLKVARICLFLGGVYDGAYPQGIDRDILLAGALLHDLGKIEEIDPGKRIHTAYGSLVGHILLSRDIVRDAAKEVEDLPPEELLHLEHLIVSHQGRKEWGAPQEPKTAEALILHYADDMDAKVNIFFNALEKDAGEEVLTLYHDVLNRQLYKGSKPQEEEKPLPRQKTFEEE